MSDIYVLAIILQIQIYLHFQLLVFIFLLVFSYKVNWKSFHFIPFISTFNPILDGINDRTYRIKHIGLCLFLLVFWQTKSDSEHRFTNHPRQLFFSDM